MTPNELRRLELVVNKRIMRGCNHPNFESDIEKEGGFTFHWVRCTDCNAREYEPTATPQEQRAANALAIQQKVPRHFADLMMARRVLRALETNSAWRASFRTVDGLTSCILMNDAEKLEIVGTGEHGELKAIAAAIQEFVGRI